MSKLAFFIWLQVNTMKNKFLFISLLFALTILSNAHASSVRTYIKSGTVTIDGKKYEKILVKCNSSIEIPNNIVREEGSKIWCSGIDPTICYSRSEMKAAQAVCKRGYLKKLANSATSEGVANDTQENAEAISQNSVVDATSVESESSQQPSVSSDDVENPTELEKEKQEALRQELIEIEEQRIQIKQRQLELRQKELELKKREIES